jgi:NAD(P)-dependent dehydrogenase (short-subunit alcohol dehydrogenase family)
METALITGGGGRIGAAIARKLAAEGWRVLLGDTNIAAARAVADSLGGAPKAIAAELDIIERETLRAKIADLAHAHGPIDALVNAAGGRSGAAAGAFCDSDPATWRTIVDLHLRGVINTCQAVLPGMIKAGRGSIVLVAAMEGLRGDQRSAVFSAAKAGVIVLAETLVRECQPHGVRVNCVLPGDPRELAKSGVNDDAGDVAEAASFLVSDRARRTNGACFDVTGGLALH